MYSVLRPVLSDGSTTNFGRTARWAETRDRTFLLCLGITTFGCHLDFKGLGPICCQTHARLEDSYA
jgi:hypothetical protein